MSKFILYPVEGLGNRLRAIDSAVRYGRDRGTSVSIRWHRDKKYLNCDWDDLFERRNDVRNAGKDYSLLRLINRKKKNCRIIRWCLNVLEKARILALCNPDEYDKLRSITASGKKYCLLIAESFSIFYWPEGEKFQTGLFQLNSELRQRLGKETGNFNEKTIGVHIRRTDNREATVGSPLELFEERMAEETANGANFYVCSDDEKVKETLISKFGSERIILPRGILNRTSKGGIQQAVVEMFALASTSKIIGSHFSSFSEIAAEIGGIPLEQLLKKTDIPTGKQIMTGMK